MIKEVDAAKSSIMNTLFPRQGSPVDIIIVNYAFNVLMHTSLLHKTKRGPEREVGRVNSTSI